MLRLTGILQAVRWLMELGDHLAAMEKSIEQIDARVDGLEDSVYELQGRVNEFVGVKSVEEEEAEQQARRDG